MRAPLLTSHQALPTCRTAPGTGKDRRRLLSEELSLGRVGAGSVRYTSLEAGPVIEGGANATAAAEDEGAVRAPATAIQPGWCTPQGWQVEQAGSGKNVWPPDLYQAMVAARQQGRMR